ncbi:MAG: hypothetical protein AB1Y36_11535 [Cycloclasticus sp.]
MKSHEFAKQLTLMAKILKSGKNTEMDDLEISQFSLSKSSSAKVEGAEIPHALNMLVGLNQVEKSQWITLINEFGFEIDIRPRDANRDIVGKLLKYLTNNPYERERLIGKKGKGPIKASDELTDALTMLLK